MNNRLSKETNRCIDAFDETMLFGMKNDYLTLYWDKNGDHSFYIYIEGTNAALDGKWSSLNEYDYYDENN
jgi:hypothetical protein